MTQCTSKDTFTTEMLIETITEVVVQKYYDYPKIKELYTIDDMIQENILWFYQPMRNGEQRLQHYLNEYSVPEVLSIIRMATRQTFNEKLRYNAVKYNPMLTLNAPMNSEDAKEFIDLVADTSEGIYSTIDTTDIYSALQATNTITDNYVLLLNNFRRLPAE